MPYDHGYGPLENQLIDLFLSGPPDFEAAERLIALGADVNAANRDASENVLSEILVDYPQSCKSREYAEICHSCPRRSCDNCEYSRNPQCGEALEQVIRFFLAHGFDVHKNNDRHGAQCLVNVVFSTRDRHSIIGLKMLLDAGAKNVPLDDDVDAETPWDQLGWDQCIWDTFLYDFHQGNISEALYQVYQAQADGRPHHGIDSYELAIGKRILRVLVEKPAQGPVFFTLDTPDSQHENCYQQTPYFQYDGGYLKTTRNADCWTDTVLPDQEMLDVSDRFLNVVGTVLTSISFDCHEIRKGTSCYIQPIIKLAFDSGINLTLSTNHGEWQNECDYAAYYSLHPSP